MFCWRIVDQQPDFFMGSLDVDSLFTNLPLEETTEICTNELFKKFETAEGLSKSDFKELLPLPIKDLHFNFDGTLYKQINDFWLWILWVGLLSWVSYNFSWEEQFGHFLPLELLTHFPIRERLFNILLLFPDSVPLFQRHLIFYSSRDQIGGLWQMSRCLAKGTMFWHLQI